jgi:hypothetical protein
MHEIEHSEATCPCSFPVCDADQPSLGGEQVSVPKVAVGVAAWNPCELVVKDLTDLHDVTRWAVGKALGGRSCRERQGAAVCAATASVELREKLDTVVEKRLFKRRNRERTWKPALKRPPRKPTRPDGKYPRYAARDGRLRCERTKLLECCALPVDPMLSLAERHAQNSVDHRHHQYARRSQWRCRLEPQMRLRASLSDRSI